MDETPEQKYSRIAVAVQQTILNSFPNADRVGCPGDVRLRQVAARRTIVEDDDWQHITHCSPCYGEFLSAKEEIRRLGRRERTLRLIGGTSLLVLVAATGGYRYWSESRALREIASIAFEPATLNLRDSSGTRGDGNTVQQQEMPALPRRPLELTIILPFGSEAGNYQFEWIDAKGRVVSTGQASASIRNGDTSLAARSDTSAFGPGDYKLGLRQGSFDWVLYPVRFR
jgi:hypothetical protein